MTNNQSFNWAKWPLVPKLIPTTFSTLGRSSKLCRTDHREPVYHNKTLDTTKQIIMIHNNNNIPRYQSKYAQQPMQLIFLINSTECGWRSSSNSNSNHIKQMTTSSKPKLTMIRPMNTKLVITLIKMKNISNHQLI